MTSVDSTPDSTLSSDVADVLHAAAELANLRFSKVIGVRSDVHAQLPLEDFVAIFDASWDFVVQCEVLCQRMIVGLRGVMVRQAKAFLTAFHQKRLTDSARLVENEQWAACDVEPRTRRVVGLVLQSAVSDPLELLLGKRKEERIARIGTTASNGAAQDGESDMETASTKQLDIEGREYFAVSAGLAGVDGLVDYLMVVMNCPLLTTDAMSKVVEYMKVRILCSLLGVLALKPFSPVFQLAYLPGRPRSWSDAIRRSEKHHCEASRFVAFSALSLVACSYVGSSHSARFASTLDYDLAHPVHPRNAPPPSQPKAGRHAHRIRQAQARLPGAPKRDSCQACRHHERPHAGPLQVARGAPYDLCLVPLFY